MVYLHCVAHLLHWNEDVVVDDDIEGMVAGTIRRARTVRARLVGVGLLQPVEGGYRPVHRWVEDGIPLPVRESMSPSYRRDIIERDGARCRTCGSVEDLVVDHIVPVSRGGRTLWENLQTLCRPCNTRKGVRVG